MPAVDVERLVTPRGELVLRRDGRHHEIISNGTFLMDDRGGASERLLAEVAAAAGGDVLVGGLGMGLTLAAVLQSPGVRSVTVVEVEPSVLRWNRTHLAAGNGRALADPRITLVEADLLAWLPTSGAAYDGICLDIDNGPDWTVVDANSALYGGAGLDLLARRLRPGGTLAVWSAAASEPFARRLRSRYDGVRAVEVAVPRGEPDVVYVATRRP